MCCPSWPPSEVMGLAGFMAGVSMFEGEACSLSTRNV